MVAELIIVGLVLGSAVVAIGTSLTAVLLLRALDKWMSRNDEDIWPW